MGRTAVEQAVLGDLAVLNSTQHRLFQVRHVGAFHLRGTGLAMGRTAVEQAVLGDLAVLNSTQHRLFQAGAACATLSRDAERPTARSLVGQRPGRWESPEQQTSDYSL